MEKLIELLNEYIPKGWSIEHGGKSVFYEGLNYNDRIIGKDFGFIKWLVENDKIDTESYCRITSVERKGEKDVYRDEVDSLLMLLAIQDEPIRFLCDILK